MRFSKWHALGNAYLVVERDDLGGPLDGDGAQRLCDVRYGLGADGVLEVCSVDGATAEIVIWNPDGSTAELSGNGTRIAASWLARRTGLDEVRIVVGAREVTARMLDSMQVETAVGTVEVEEMETIDVLDERIELTSVSVGNPHAVVRRDYTRDDLLALGPAIERHPRFPERTNVQLVRVEGLNELTIAVWERGAGETTASGSSAVAAAAAAIANGWCESPVLVHMPGGDLVVSIDEENSATLVGPAEEIASGELAIAVTRS